MLSSSSSSFLGLGTGGFERYGRVFWELDKKTNDWSFLQTAPSESKHFDGLSSLVYWDHSIDRMRGTDNQYRTQIHNQDQSGQQAWRKVGIALSLVGDIRNSLYVGSQYDKSMSVISPHEPEDIISIYSYCKSPQYQDAVRELDQNVIVASGTLAKVPFDKKYWENLARGQYPNGLPQPYSNDPKQWVFHGHPCASVIWNEDTKTTAISDIREGDTVLQVAVARLLGYRWPAELDTEMELAPEMRKIIAQNKVFDGLVDDDGIVCIPAIRGEKPAVDRLEAILHAAYGDEWSATVLNNLLKSVKSRDLNIWLRDKFFEQHCKIFQHRPFIWHIWDGLPDGFSALVNYHQLDYKGLERLIYTYLDDWISTQIQLEKDGDEGAEIRLAAARNLRKQLEDILVGEKGLDIFVRWKLLEEQPIGWNPDLNDGVRLNIRPFMKAKDVGKKDAGILRSKPNIHWKKDRGTDVASAPWYDLGLEYGGKQGDRINDHHLTLAEKKAVRVNIND